MNDDSAEYSLIEVHQLLSFIQYDVITDPVWAMGKIIIFWQVTELKNSKLSSLDKIFSCGLHEESNFLG